MGGRLGVDVAFRDKAAANWMRQAPGSIEELTLSPVDHFRPPGLYDFSPPEPLP
jgi:hypothetical protein